MENNFYHPVRTPTIGIGDVSEKFRNQIQKYPAPQTWSEKVFTGNLESFKHRMWKQSLDGASIFMVLTNEVSEGTPFFPIPWELHIKNRCLFLFFRGGTNSQTEGIHFGMQILWKTSRYTAPVPQAWFAS